jgi:hypothetical protein
MARQNQVDRLVLDYALSDLPNLEATLACVRTFPKIAVEVASRFTILLKDRLARDGDSKWKIQIRTDAAAGPDGERVSITMPDWSDLRVVLAHDWPVPYGSNGSCYAYLQVRGSPPAAQAISTTEAETFRAVLIPILHAQCGNGREDSSWWPYWYQWIEEYGDWSNPDVILELAKGDCAVEFFVAALVRLARSVEEAIEVTKAARGKNSRRRRK